MEVNKIEQLYNLNITPWSSPEIPVGGGSGQFIIPAAKYHRSSLIELKCTIAVSDTANIMYQRADCFPPITQCIVQKDSQQIAQFQNLAAAQHAYYWNNMQRNCDLDMALEAVTTDYATKKALRKVGMGSANEKTFSIFYPLHHFLPHLLFDLEQEVCEVYQQLTITMQFASLDGTCLFASPLANVANVSWTCRTLLQTTAVVTPTKLILSFVSKVMPPTTEVMQQKRTIQQISYALAGGANTTASYTPLMSVSSSKILILQQLIFMNSIAANTGLTFDEPRVTSNVVTLNGYQFINAQNKEQCLAQMNFSLQKGQQPSNNFSHEYHQLFNNTNVQYNFQTVSVTATNFYITYVFLEQ